MDRITLLYGLVRPKVQTHHYDDRTYVDSPAELDMAWAHLWVALGWVGSGRVDGYSFDGTGSHGLGLVKEFGPMSKPVTAHAGPMAGR